MSQTKEQRKREILRRLQTPPEQPVFPQGEYIEQPISGTGISVSGTTFFGTGEYVDEPIGANRFGWYVETKP